MNDHFVWPSDADRAENDELNRVCEYLEEVIDHIPDATKMIQGNAVVLGQLSQFGETYSPAMLIEFASVEDFNAAREAGQCRFTVFGGEV